MTNTERIQANNAELRGAIQMAENLPDAGGTVADPVIQPLEVTENGTYTAPSGVDGYSPISVNVPIPDGYINPSGELDVTEIGTYDVREYASVNVNIPTGGGGDPDLPTGYRRCDYIRFNDAQIIDTGVICNQNTKIKVLFTRENTNAMYLYGVLSDGNTATISAYLSSGGSWRFGNKSASKTVIVSEDIIHTCTVQKSGIVSDGGNTSYSDVSDFVTIGSLLFGATRNASGTVAAAQYIGKIFLIEMWNGAEQVLRLIPVTDGNVYRFWDSIGQKFHDSITITPLDGGNL